MITESECIALLVPLGWGDWQAQLGFHANFCCEYCDRDLLKTVDDYDAWQVDHIVPVTRGGIDEQWNRALACKTCNFIKSNRMLQAGVDPRIDRPAAITAIRLALRELRAAKQTRLDEVRQHFRCRAWFEARPWPEDRAHP